MKIICILIILFSSVVCQANQNLIIEIFSGVETGWWVYNKGSTEEGIQNNLGWDRTRHRPFIPIELGIYYKINRIKIGVGVVHSWFFENAMLSSYDSYFFPNNYQISENSIKILQMNLQTEFDLVQKPNYSLGPLIKFGIFDIDTNHPQKDNFGTKTVFGFGITNQIKLSKATLLIRPIFHWFAIQPKVEKVFNEKHNIYSIGLNIGLRYSLF